MITERRRQRGKGKRMRYADREAQRRTAERVERTRKMGETGRREKKCTCVEEKKSEEKLEGEEKRTGRENTLVPGVGDCARGARGARDGAKVTAKQAAVRRTKRARG